MEKKHTFTGWRAAKARLWTRYGGEWFTFSQAVETIYRGTKPTQSELKNIYKKMKAIEDNYYLISTHMYEDPRNNKYRMLAPNQVEFATGVFLSQMPRKPREVRVSSAHSTCEAAFKVGHMDYMFNRETALSEHTNNYISAGHHMHISVMKSHLDAWISLLRRRGYGIQIAGEIYYSSPTHVESFDLQPDLQTRENEKGENHYQKKEYTIIQQLEENDLIGAYAVLIAQRANIDYELLGEETVKRHVVNSIGFGMKVINHAAKKNVFPPSRIGIIRKHTIPTRAEVLGDPKQERQYLKLSERWGVACFGIKPTIDKLVLDLVR